MPRRHGEGPTDPVATLRRGADRRRNSAHSEYVHSTSKAAKLSTHQSFPNVRCETWINGERWPRADGEDRMMRKASGIASAVTTLRTRRGVHPLLVRARAVSSPWAGIAEWRGSARPRPQADRSLTAIRPMRCTAARRRCGLRSFPFDDPRPLLGAGPDQVTFELGDHRKDVESARPPGSMGSSASTLVAVW